MTPEQKKSNRRMGLILASIAVVFFLGLFASRLIGDTSLAMTAIGAAVFFFLLFGIGRHLRK